VSEARREERRSEGETERQREIERSIYSIHTLLPRNIFSSSCSVTKKSPIFLSVLLIRCGVVVVVVVVAAAAAAAAANIYDPNSIHSLSQLLYCNGVIALQTKVLGTCSLDTLASV
jgi:hypothetical protein